MLSTQCIKRLEREMFDRITTNPGILDGKPIIQGTRLSVEFILELIASGGSITDIVQSYPFLSEEDVRQAAHHSQHQLA